MGYNSEDSFINSIVGEGTHFRGHLELAGLLRIDGDFSGSIKTSGKVLVGKDGRADCNIDAGTVVIGGIVRGTVSSSEKVIVLSSAIVIGDVYAPRLIAEEGVVIDGRLSIRGSGETDRSSDSPVHRNIRMAPPRTAAGPAKPSPMGQAARRSVSRVSDR